MEAALKIAQTLNREQGTKIKCLKNFGKNSKIYPLKCQEKRNVRKIGNRKKKSRFARPSSKCLKNPMLQM